MLPNFHRELPYVSLQESPNEGLGPLKNPEWKRNKAYIILRGGDSNLYIWALITYQTLLYCLLILTTFCWVPVICITHICGWLIWSPESFSNLPTPCGMQVDIVKMLLLSVNLKRKRGWNIYFLHPGLIDKWFTYHLYITLWLTVDKICWIQLNIFSSSKNRIDSYILWIKLKWAWQCLVWIKYNIFLKECTFVPNIFREPLYC